jgi:redox-sensitive bicupin YhaK (pirin superfamily)
MVGPFIFADVIGPEVLEPGSGTNVDAHPHIGLSTVTYLLDGRIVHRDSTGAVQVIEPGAMNWMTAGSGVSHTERSDPDDVATVRNMHGLQTWVALPDELEDTEPRFQHVDASNVPTDTHGRSTIRVAAGSGWGLESPATGSSPLVLAEIRLDETSPVPVGTDHTERAVIAISGEITVNGARIDAGQLAVLRTGKRVTLSGNGTAANRSGHDTSGGTSSTATPTGSNKQKQTGRLNDSQRCQKTTNHSSHYPPDLARLSQTCR